MFKMMNTERVAVGIQSLGISEGAWRAVAYAGIVFRGAA